MKKTILAYAAAGLVVMSCGSASQVQTMSFDDGLYYTAPAPTHQVTVEAEEMDNLLADTKQSPAYIISSGDTLVVPPGKNIVVTDKPVVTWNYTYDPWLYPYTWNYVYYGWGPYYSPYWYRHYSYWDPWYYSSWYYRPWYYDAQAVLLRRLLFVLLPPPLRLLLRRPRPIPPLGPQQAGKDE